MLRFAKTDRAIVSAIVFLLCTSIFVALVYNADFGTVYAVEDGPVEYATAVFLLIGGVTMLYNARHLMRPTALAATLTIIYGALFILAAGEEVSWGQRIFGWASGEFFLEHNYQDETNLHNLVVGDVHLAKIVFGHALSIIVLIYLVALPFAYERAPGLARLMNAISAPVPSTRHAILAVLATLVIQMIDADRKWEVYELVFALLTWSIFLNPNNPLYKQPVSTHSTKQAMLSS